MSIPTDIKDLLELSPPVALLVALLMLGFYLKRSPFPSWAIPLTNGAIGAGIYPFVAEMSKVSFQVKNPMVFNALLGLVVGLASSGLQTQFKGILERFLPTNGESKEREKTNEKDNPPTGGG